MLSKQDVELAFLIAGIPVRIRKRKDGFIVYCHPLPKSKRGHFRFDIKSEEDVRKVIAEIKLK